MFDIKTRDAVTTNNTKPQRASYPVPRKPAVGPLITTETTGPAKKAAVGYVPKVVPAKKKSR